MNLYYLNDIRKSYYLISLYSYHNENSLIIINDNILDNNIYFRQLLEVFPKCNFIKQSDFISKNYTHINLYVNFSYYTDDVIYFIKNLNCKDISVILDPNVGIDIQEKTVLDLCPTNFICWNSKYINYLITNRNSLIRSENGYVIKEVNFIFNKPLFNHPDIDILIFFPTQMAFANNLDLSYFIFNLFSLCKKIGANENIYLKMHNGSEKHYLDSNNLFFHFIAKLFFILPKSIIKLLVIVFKSQKKALEVLNFILLNKLVSKYKFKNINYTHIPIEFYFPFVKKKIIGRYSNTLIISSYFNLKAEICGKINIPKLITKRNLTVSTNNHLELNMNFFYNQKKNKYSFSKDMFLDEI
jgi:hypothetical protein